MHRIERNPPRNGGKVCAFTGHRPAAAAYLGRPSSPEYRALYEKVKNTVRALAERGFSHFMSGGALGADRLAALAVMEMKKEYPFITLEIVQPCPEQADRWSRAEREAQEALLQAADRVTVVCESYVPGCMQLRNRFMVDACEAVVGIYNGSPGGTRSTLEYALNENKEVLILTP